MKMKIDNGLQTKIAAVLTIFELLGITYYWLDVFYSYCDKDLGCSVSVNITTSCVWFISFTMEGCNLMRNRNIKEIEETQIWGWDSVFNVFALYFVLCPLQLNNSLSFCHCFGNWKIYLLIRDKRGNTSSFASL